MAQRPPRNLNGPPPFLPRPIAEDVMATLAQVGETAETCEAQQAQITSFRAQNSAAIDTVDLAISQNHADYLAGRPSWSYETRIEIEGRLRILKRQRQHLQEIFGQVNRRHKHLTHVQYDAPRAQQDAEGARAQRFVQAAEHLLDPATITVLWEIVEAKQGG